MRSGSLLFLGSFLLLLTVSSGHFGWTDDKVALQAMHSFVNTGVASVRAEEGNVAKGRDGLSFSRADIGVKLVAMPAFLIGSAVDSKVPMPARLRPLLSCWADIGAILCSSAQVALIVVLAAVTLATLRVPWMVASALALLIVLGSPLVEVSRYMISNTPATLGWSMALLALARLYRRRMSGPRKWRGEAHLLGAGLFLMLASRQTGVLFLPAIVFALISFPALRSRTAARFYLTIGGWVIAAVLLKLWYNHHRTGSFFATGYEDQGGNYFKRSLAAGLMESLFVPRWSLFVNSPMTLVSLFGIAGLLRSRNRSRIAAFLILALLPPLGTYSMYVVPEQYATRYLSEIIYLLSLAGAVWAGRRIRGSAYRLIACVALGVAGVAMHFCATLLPFARFRPQYSTAEAPAALGVDLLRAFRYPPEAFEYFQQLTWFPHPDWFFSYLFPRQWPLAILVLAASAVVLICLAAMRSSRQRLNLIRLQKLAFYTTLILVIAAPVGLFVTASGKRKLVLSGATSGAPAPPGRPGVERVDVYLAGDLLVADYLVRFPGGAAETSASQRMQSFDAMLVVPNGASRSPEFPIGGANLFNGYLYGARWEQMPAESTLVFPNAREVRLPPDFVKWAASAPQDAVLRIAYSPKDQFELLLTRASRR